MAFKQQIIEINNEELDTCFFDDMENSDFDIENFYLEATTESENSMLRCTTSFSNIRNYEYSPTLFEKLNSPENLAKYNQHKGINEIDFSLHDSYLLMPSQNPMENIDQLTQVTNYDDETIDFNSEDFRNFKTSTTNSESDHESETQLVSEMDSAFSINESRKVSCKAVYKCLVKPLTSKFVKKFMKKQNVNKKEESDQVVIEKTITTIRTTKSSNFTASTELNHDNSEFILAPIYCPSINKSNQMSPIENRTRSQIYNTISTQIDHTPIKKTDNFDKCGDIVYYYV